jgi:hypothetical protein
MGNSLAHRVAFLSSVFLGNRLFAHFGIMIILLSFAVASLVGLAALVLSGAFAVLGTFRFVQMALVAGPGRARRADDRPEGLRAHSAGASRDGSGGDPRAVWPTRGERDARNAGRMTVSLSARAGDR